MALSSGLRLLQRPRLAPPPRVSTSHVSCQPIKISCALGPRRRPSNHPLYAASLRLVLVSSKVSAATKLQASEQNAQITRATWTESDTDDVSNTSESDLDLEFEDELEVDGAGGVSDGEGAELDEELEEIKRSLGPSLDLEVAEEEWDEEELDELFEEFGETIVQSEGSADGSDTSALRLAAPTDEDSVELAVALASAANDTKAGNIRVLDVRPLVYWTQYFVVATAFSRPQMDAMSKRMSDLAEEKYSRALRAPERQTAGPWTLLDYGDVVVHLFAPRERERYAIEEFYANAQEVELPFVQTEPNFN